MMVSPESQGYGQYLVEAGHELWTAHSDEVLRAGEIVKAAAAEGIRLVVKRVDKESKQNEWRSH